MSTNYNKLLEDSRSNKFLIFFKEGSLYSKSIKIGYQSTETILINDVFDHYVAFIDANDTIFVACYTKERNIALISSNDSHWELKETITTPKEVDIILLELFNIKGVMHIIYATCLSIKNYYNIYHIYFMNNAWNKENIGEIYSYNLCDSYSCSISSDGVIHFISIHNDRKVYFIKHSIFNSSMRWSSRIVSSLNNSNIHVNLLNNGKNLYLICYSSEEKVFIYYHFINKCANGDLLEFEFITKIKFLDMNLKPVFYTLNNSIFMALISGEIYYEYILNDTLKEWETYLKLPLNNKINQIRLVVYHNKFLDRGYDCFFDEANKLLLPINKLFTNAINENDTHKIQQDYYVPYLVDQIKQLSEEIKTLSTNLNEIRNITEVKENTYKIIQTNKVQSEYKVNIKEKNLMNNDEKNSIQKKTVTSNFKQTFMKDDKLLKSLDSKFAANFLEVSKNNINKSTYNNSKIPYTNKKFINDFQSKKSISSFKTNLLTDETLDLKGIEKSEAVNQKDEAIELNKSNLPGLMKKIGDLFK